MTVVVIGGTGVYQWPGLTDSHSQKWETPFGPPSSPIVTGRWRGSPMAFLARHGENHEFLPHQVNYRANIHACSQLKPTAVVAINSVGSMSDDLPPGSLGLPDQLIDYTWGRAHTFAGEIPLETLYADMTAPYSPSVRQQLIDADSAGRLARSQQCVYGAVQGPRLETAAEVRRLTQDGCHVVGMTGMPEAGLAAELGLPFVCVTLTANWAAGYAGTQHIELEEIMAHIERAQVNLRALLSAWLENA
ncbi:MAG: S-methyl-5'-thioinosine phosphorylase [Lysobacterales bacterium]